MSNLQVTPITGLPQVDGWSQVISNPSGSLFCVLGVQGQNANSVGKNLSELLLNSSANSSSELHNLLLDLLQRAREELCQIQCACLILTPEKKIIIAAQKGSVFLKRQEKVGEILISDGSLEMIEGNFKNGDIFALVTQQAKEIFPQLKNSLIDESEVIATKLVAELQEQTDSSLTAIAWLEQDKNQDHYIENHTPTKKTRLKLIGIIPSLNKLKTQNSILLKQAKHLISKFSLKKIKPINSRIIGEKIENDQKNNFPTFIKIGIILILILIVAIFWKQQAIKKELAPILPTLQTIDERFDKIKKEANQQTVESRTQAKEMLKELETLITQNQDKQVVVEEIKKHYQKIQEFLVTVSGTETKETLDPFFDLRLTELEFITKKSSLANNKLFSLDASGKNGIILNLENRQAQKISLEEINGEAKAIAINNKNIFVLGNGLHSFSINGENYKKLKDEGDSDKAGTLLEGYSDYLYVLNPEKRNIYRYTVKEDGLSEPIGWLIDKQGIDFSTIESMTIDGDVWLSTKNGEILRYTQGKKQDFTIKDLESPLTGPIKITTHEETDLLFVLDKNNHRVVVIRKDGTFVKEVVSESLSAGDNIVTLNNETGVLVISGSIVYKISL